MQAINKEIKRFSLNISKEELINLEYRLKNTRLPDQDREKKWNTGVDLVWFRSLLNYWISEFDWKKSESDLNSFSQFKTTINGDDIHFIHQFWLL